MYKIIPSSTVAVANLTASQKKKMKKYDNLHYLKQLKNFHEMQEMKVKNINYRNHMLSRQKIVNYRNELDRLNGEISQSVFKGVTHEHLNKRKPPVRRPRADFTSGSTRTRIGFRLLSNRGCLV